MKYYAGNKGNQHPNNNFRFERFFKFNQNLMVKNDRKSKTY